MKLLSHDTMSRVFLCRMAKTRGGIASRPVTLPRIYMQPNGVKVRRMDGGVRYQPPSNRGVDVIALLGQVSNLFSDRQVETSRSPSSHPEDNSPTLRLVDIFQAQPYAVMQNN